MGYEPEYAKGQILVVFKNRCGEGFAQDFGKTLGYRLLDETYEHGEAYIFQTEVGKENEAKERFAAYSEFVDWADLRDIKMEARWNSLEQAIAKIQDLHDNVEIPDNSYNQRLKEIIEYIRQQRSD
jgi:hypothetical protein